MIDHADSNASPLNGLSKTVMGLMVFLACATGASGYETDKVALVIIDGLRYTEGLGDPDHTYVPEMSALAQQGAIIEPFTNNG